MEFANGASAPVSEEVPHPHLSLDVYACGSTRWLRRGKVRAKSKRSRAGSYAGSRGGCPGGRRTLGRRSRGDGYTVMAIEASRVGVGATS